MNKGRVKRVAATAAVVTGLTAFGLIVSGDGARALRAFGFRPLDAVEALPGSMNVKRETARWNGEIQESLSADIDEDARAVVARYERLFADASFGDDAAPARFGPAGMPVARASAPGHETLGFVDRKNRRVAVIAYRVPGVAAHSRYYVFRSVQPGATAPTRGAATEGPLPGGILAPDGTEVLFRLDRGGDCGLAMIESDIDTPQSLLEAVRGRLVERGWSVSTGADGLEFEGAGVHGMVTVEEQERSGRSLLTVLARPSGR